MFTKVLVILLLAHAYQAQKEYVPPAALVEPLCPNGFRISIPDESGIESVVYHIRINHEVVILESAHLTKNNSSEKHGRWTYQNKTIQLKKGDVIYYMVHVKNKGVGYNLADQEHVVTDFHDHGGNKIESSNICNITNAARTYQAQRPYTPPSVLVEPLYPIGISMSVPDEAGIQLVAFHVKVNDEMVGLEVGTIARDIPSAKRGRWTYHDRTTQLQKGDTVYYWIHVIYRGLGYNLVDQEHVVTDFYDYNGNKIQSADGCYTSTGNKAL